MWLRLESKDSGSNVSREGTPQPRGGSIPIPPVPIAAPSAPDSIPLHLLTPVPSVAPAAARPPVPWSTEPPVPAAACLGPRGVEYIIGDDKSKGDPKRVRTPSYQGGGVSDEAIVPLGSQHGKLSGCYGKCNRRGGITR
jgi:hypothetical protein